MNRAPGPRLAPARPCPRAVGLLTAVAGGMLAAHVVPAGTWLAAPRRRLFAGLAGLGRADHVALTFDDGPDPETTPFFLDALERLATRATFFLLGERVSRHPELSRDITSRGHEVAVHGWVHSRPWRPAPVRDATELARAVDAVHRTTGTVPHWYRPPYGILSGGRLLAARRAGLRPVLWSAWGRDWTARATPESVLRTVRRDLRGGGTVLLHDSDHTTAAGSWRVTLETLAPLVHGCRELGLEVGPLAEHAVPGRGGHAALHG